MESYFKGPWLRREHNKQASEHFESTFGKLCLYDLGASGGTPPPFLFLGKQLKVVTFEPEPDATVESEAINCPVAVGPRNLDTLFLNRRPTTSSLLRPNPVIVDRYDWSIQFPDQGNIFETVKEVKIETVPLDEAVAKFELPEPDFLKIDVQGLTYEVLEEAAEILGKRVLGLQVEMEFSEAYGGQKTFGAVHELLLSFGFEVFELSNINRWRFKTKRKVKKPRGQEVFCDMTYFLGPERFFARDNIGVEELKKIVGLFVLYGFNDAAQLYLEKGIEKGLIEAGSDAESLASEWPGSIDYFFRRSTRDKLSNLGGVDWLDLSLKKILNKRRRLFK